MVGADDEQSALAGDRVLRDHPHACLDVALAEVAERRSDRVGVLLGEPVDRRLDVEDDGLLGPDEGQRELRVVLVALHAVGQPHGDEPRGAALGDELVDGEPAQAPRERGVLAAADAEHEALGAGRAQVRLQEVDRAPAPARRGR